MDIKNEDKRKSPIFVKYGIIAAVAIVVIIAAVLFSFNSSEPYVAKVGGEKIGKGEFSYYLVFQKQTMFNEARSVDPDIDAETFWNTKINGEDAIDVAKKKTLESMKTMKIQLIKAKEAGITLAQEDLDNIDNWINFNIIQNPELGDGNKVRANTKLKDAYGIDTEQLKKLNEDIVLMSEYQISEIEKINVDEADIEKYYNENLDWFKESEMRIDGEEAVWTRHILITANRETASTEQLDEAQKKADDILAKVKAGEDFAELAAEYSEDGNASQGGGYVFGKGRMVPEFENAAFTMEPGHVNAVVVQTSYGFHVLMLEEKYQQDQPVSLRCAIEHYEYGPNFIKGRIYLEQVEEWKNDSAYKLELNQKVYDEIDG